ncbi:MAG: EAL domain-containing protein [Lysobacterales bacterium]
MNTAVTETLASSDAPARIRVLLVDDDADDRLLLNDLFTYMSEPDRFRVDTVANYEGALRALAQHRHDVALIDYQLGARTGLDLLLATTADPERPPLIVLTGHSDRELDQCCLRAGASDYLAKSGLYARTLERSILYAIERHQLQRLLSAREQSYRLLFESNPSPTLLHVPETCAIVAVNQAAIDLYGYTREEFLGLTTLDLRPPEDVQKLLDFQQRHPRFDTVSPIGLWRHRVKSGRLIEVEIKTVDIEFEQRRVRMAQINDVSARVQAEAERQRQLTHDSLTGLRKHSGAEALIETLIEHCRLDGSRLVLLFVDIDRFNAINEGSGIAVGDAVLKMVAERLGIAAGADALITRHAGDQFILALPGIARDADVLALANAFCECLAEPLQLSDGTALYITASIGAAVFPDTAATQVQLCHQAEVATHRAKRGGRNAASLFHAELQAVLDDRLQLGRRIRDALVHEEFQLYFQPQVAANAGLIGFEALLRWDCPGFGLLLPNRFIPLAEDNGMILPLGAWVLRQACQWLRHWRELGFTEFVVGVNVAAAQLQRPDFVAQVEALLAETGVPASMLELELTESGLFDNRERAVAHMGALKALGVKLSIDDFGTGYSSLSHLKNLPFDKLKIDQSFVANVTQNGDDAALVRAIIALGHHLDMTVVAEGVETAGQFSHLLRNHCDQFQGYYFSQAVPAHQVAGLLSRPSLLPPTEAPQASLRTLLILDDEENIRRSLQRLLRRDGYRILLAASAAEAFDALARESVQVVVSDQRMPGMSGTEFLSQVRALYPDTVRIVLSGYTDLSSVTEAINRGAIYKFLTKPWDDEDLRRQIQEAFRRQEHRHDTAEPGP